jgi:hypothetical protein
VRAAFVATGMARQIGLSVTSQRMSKEERETWNTTHKLIAYYEQDRKEIEAAEQALPAAGRPAAQHQDREAAKDSPGADRRACRTARIREPVNRAS